MSDEYLHTFSAMGTVVTIQVVGHGEHAKDRTERERVVRRAAGWFDHVERACSRFDASSEIAGLSTRIGEAIPASDLVFEAVRFAIAVAEESDGAFDPTVGRRMERLGFDRAHRTGETVRTHLDPAPGVSYLDVHLDESNRTITLGRPLLLDLGAVVKGMAIDMAARELAPFENFAVDAGGDLYLGGHNARDEPWAVGIRHPRAQQELIETLHVSDTAVCTSGDYERTSRHDGNTHHILDPRSGQSATGAASVTTVATSAMVADALATAAFVLGAERGIALLDRHEVDGLIVTTSLERFATSGMSVHMRETTRR